MVSFLRLLGHRGVEDVSLRATSGPEQRSFEELNARAVVTVACDVAIFVDQQGDPFTTSTTCRTLTPSTTPSRTPLTFAPPPPPPSPPPPPTITTSSPTPISAPPSPVITPKPPPTLTTLSPPPPITTPAVPTIISSSTTSSSNTVITSQPLNQNAPVSQTLTLSSTTPPTSESISSVFQTIGSTDQLTSSTASSSTSVLLTSNATSSTSQTTGIESSGPNGHHGLSPAIIGAIAGVIILMVLGIIITLLVCRRRRRGQHDIAVDAWEGHDVPGSVPSTIEKMSQLHQQSTPVAHYTSHDQTRELVSTTELISPSDRGPLGQHATPVASYTSSTRAELSSTTELVPSQGIGTSTRDTTHIHSYVNASTTSLTSNQQSSTTHLVPPHEAMPLGQDVRAVSSYDSSNRADLNSLADDSVHVPGYTNSSTTDFSTTIGLSTEMDITQAMIPPREMVNIPEKRMESDEAYTSARPLPVPQPMSLPMASDTKSPIPDRYPDNIPHIPQQDVTTGDMLWLQQDPHRAPTNEEWSHQVRGDNGLQRSTTTPSNRSGFSTWTACTGQTAPPPYEE